MKKIFLSIALFFLALSSFAKIVPLEKARDMRFAVYTHNLSRDNGQPVVKDASVIEYKNNNNVLYMLILALQVL